MSITKEECEEIEAFIKKGRELKPGSDVYYRPSRRGLHGVFQVRIAYREPIRIYLTRYSPGPGRKVLWSPNKLRDYLFRELTHEWGFWSWLSNWGPRRVAEWWGSEWASEVNQ